MEAYGTLPLLGGLGQSSPERVDNNIIQASKKTRVILNARFFHCR